MAAWLAVGLAAAWGLRALDSIPIGTMEEFAQRMPAAGVVWRQAHDRFASFSPEVQERIRQLHRHIETSDRRDQLRRTMEQYCRFLTSLPPYERVELQTLPPEKRLDEPDSFMRSSDAIGREWKRFGPSGGPSGIAVCSR